MSSELRPSEAISEFVSDGPNNYAYTVPDTVTISKVTGIKVYYNASNLVNIVVIRDIILRGTGDEPTVLNVHTEKKIKSKRKGEGEPLRLSPNPKIRITELNFSRDGD